MPVDNIAKGVMDLERIFIRTVEKPDLSAARSSVHFCNMPGEVDGLLRAIRDIAAHQSDYL